MVKKKAPDSDSVDVTVFVPAGSVRRDEILKTALLGARDAIPPARTSPPTPSGTTHRRSAVGETGW